MGTPILDRCARDIAKVKLLRMQSCSTLDIIQYERSQREDFQERRFTNLLYSVNSFSAFCHKVWSLLINWPNWALSKLPVSSPRISLMALLAKKYKMPGEEWKCGCVSHWTAVSYSHLIARHTCTADMCRRGWIMATYYIVLFENREFGK